MASPIRRPARRIGLVAAALALFALGVGATPGDRDSPFGTGIALAATPSASPETGDTRSAGEAPGFVGSPLFAILGVLVIGVASAAATLLYVRVDRRAPASAATNSSAAARSPVSPSSDLRRPSTPGDTPRPSDSPPD